LKEIFGMRRIAIAAALMVGVVPAMAMTVSDVPALPAVDRAEVNGLEKQYFDAIERDGVEAALVGMFRSRGVADRLGDAMVKDMRTLDDQCGKLTSVERYGSESFGSRVVRDHFVAVHGSCLVRWDLTYAKTNLHWSFDRFRFHTLQGDDWVR
jgi:hypothetical protein